MKEMFSEFKATSFKEWKNKANFDLDGKDYNKTLTSQSVEGINIPAFFSAESNFKKIEHSRYTDEKLKVAKTFTLKKNVKSLKILKSILAEEFDAIKLFIPSGFDLSILIEYKNLFTRDIQFEFELFEESYLETILKLSHKMKLGKIIFLNLDFITQFSKRGNWMVNKNKDFELLKKSNFFSEKNIIPFSVNTSIYQNAGANITQQIAYSLAISVEYAQILGEDFFHNVQYIFSFGTNFFFEIAKLSAFDYLINLVKLKYNTKSENIILGESSYRNKVDYSPINNILRSATEAFSAILSGVNTFLSYPFDSSYGMPNSFSDKIAYNQVLTLKQKLHLNLVGNISEGSYYVEFIKLELAERALEIFKSIEVAGGFIKQLEQGVIQRKIRESDEKERELIKKGVMEMVDVNCEGGKYKNTPKKNPYTKKIHEKIIINKIVPSRLMEYKPN